MDQVAADSPIVLFDSGVGGLTVLGAMRKLLPQAPVIYAADMAGLPYGAKSEAEVAARVAGLLGRIAERYDPRLICIACNTASTIALGMVRDVLETPIVGTVPAIKPAAAMTETGVIGLLGTEATVRPIARCCATARTISWRWARRSCAARRSMSTMSRAPRRDWCCRRMASGSIR